MNFFRGCNVSEHPDPRTTALENAWKIHDAQGDWTNRVDAKAAFVFTIQSAAIATAVSLAPKIEILRNSKPVLCFFLVGVCSLIVGVVFAALAVIPRLRYKEIAKETEDNFIYFGHARHWAPEELERELQQVDLLAQLSRQIVVTAEIAWAKHQQVKRSFICALLGLFSLTISGLILLVF